MSGIVKTLSKMPPAQQILYPLGAAGVLSFFLTGVQSMGAYVPSTIANKEWPVATKAYIKFQNMNTVWTGSWY